MICFFLARGKVRCHTSDMNAVEISGAERWQRVRFEIKSFTAENAEVSPRSLRRSAVLSHRNGSLPRTYLAFKRVYRHWMPLR